jgi:phosphoribosylamine--glycine ligase
VAAYARSVDVVIIGPEAPLAAGIVDALNDHGVRAFGPTQQAALIESNKGWARAFMSEHGIKGCPKYALFDDLNEADRFIKRISMTAS